MKIKYAFPKLELTNEEYSTLTKALALIGEMAEEIDTDDWSYVSPYFHAIDLVNIAEDINTIMEWSKGKVGKD